MKDSRLIFALLMLFTNVMVARSAQEFLDEEWAHPEVRESPADLADTPLNTGMNGEMKYEYNAWKADKHENQKEADSKQVLPVSSTFNKVCSAEADNDNAPNIFRSSKNKRTTNQNRRGQRRSSTCNRALYMCRGLNHPQCIVKFEAPSSTLGNNICRVNVTCNFSNNFENSVGCFASKRAFPHANHPTVNQSTLQYNFTLELGGNNGSNLFSQRATMNEFNATLFVGNKVNQYRNNSLQRISIATDYICAHMTPCTLNG